MLVIAFGQGLKDHLRATRGQETAPTEARPSTDPVHDPVRLAGSIYETLPNGSAREAGTAGPRSGSTDTSRA